MEWNGRQVMIDRSDCDVIEPKRKFGSKYKASKQERASIEHFNLPGW
jgi:hypothetical protein